MATRFTAPQCSFTVDGDVIRTDGSVHNKVTGTGMAGVLDISPWSSPFQIACSLLGLGRENIDGKPAVEAGKALEPVIIDYLGRTYPDVGLFLPAERVFEKRTGDHDSWESDFSDDTFAGHVDGIVMRKAEDGSSEEHILEIKTTENAGAWGGAEHNGVPEYYYLQIALYNEFLTQKDKAYVGVGFVDKYAYANPQSWIPSTQTTTLMEMPINRESFRETMETVREWYNEYVLNNVTPPYNPENPRDVELFEHLKNLTATIDEARADLQTLSDLEKEIKLRELSYVDLVNRKDEVQARLKDYMAFNNLAILECADCASALSVSERKTIDKNMLIEDGIDPDKYSKTTSVSTFRLKRKN